MADVSIKELSDDIRAAIAQLKTRPEIEDVGVITRIGDGIAWVYGLTQCGYNEMLEAQGGKCVICGKTAEQNGKMLAVDHCHVSGNNRELLCSSCNICIGFIEKNKLDISLIHKYLTKHTYVVHAH